VKGSPTSVLFTTFARLSNHANTSTNAVETKDGTVVSFLETSSWCDYEEILTNSLVDSSKSSHVSIKSRPRIGGASEIGVGAKVEPSGGGMLPKVP